MQHLVKPIQAMADNTLVVELAATRYPLLQRGGVRQIGIHGARGTGKTCYLAALYGRRTGEKIGFSISLNPDNPDDSINHLSNAWRALQSGSVPPATALVNPFRLSLTASYQGQSWSIRTQDYAGVLVERTATGTPDLKQEVLQWLSECDGVLIFVDLSEPRSQLLERLNEVDMLINRLRTLSPDGQTIPIPVAVVFTKWDRVAGDLSGADWRQQQDKLRHYLAANPDFKQFHDQVQFSGERVEIFPVSAFGKAYDNNLPPPSGVHPFGIHEPILWLLQECDQAILDAADMLTAPLLSKRWANYHRAIAIYKGVAQHRQITRGPVADQIGQRLRQCRMRRFSRSAALAGCAVTLALALFTAGVFAWDTYQYRQVCRTFQDVRFSPEDKEALAKPYLNTKNPFADWLGRRQDIHHQLDKARKKWHDEDYGELCRYYLVAKDSDDKQQELKKRLAEFLRRWPDSEHRPEVEAWLNNAEARIHDFQELKAYEALLQFVTQYPKDSEAEQRIQAAEKFLTDYPQSKFKSEVESIKRTAEKISHDYYWGKYQALHDKWTATQTECEELAGKRYFDAAIEKCVEFRGECEKFRREQQSRPAHYSKYYQGLEDLIGKANQAGDQYQWRKVEHYAASNQSDYKGIIELAEKYKYSKIFPVKRYSKKAEELIHNAVASWDKEEYEKFLDAATYAVKLEVKTDDMGRKTRAFETAAKEARAYLESGCPSKKHKAAVKKWLDWFDSISKEPIAVDVMIVRAEIAGNASTITDPFDPPDVRITLRLNTAAAAGQVWTTGVVNDSFRPQYNHSCKGVKIAWNDASAVLSLTLTDEDTIWDDVITETYKGPDVIFLLNDGVWVQDGLGWHRVYLVCEALRPPPLPKYEDNPQ
ncbi:hypothetical protein HRbin36_01288 [bacterium HR36]|nr:hypothetical protein HRbin36_01288 [bacterium HR36]